MMGTGNSSRRLFSVALALLALLGSSATAMKKERAAEFELEDQFGKRVTCRFPKNRPSILAFGDREGAQQIEGWIRPIYERFGPSVDIHGIAVLREVPALFRGFARSQFRRRIKYPVLLDFKGDVTERYGYAAGKANVIIVDRNGEILLKETGPATPEKLQRIYRALESLL